MWAVIVRGEFIGQRISLTKQQSICMWVRCGASRVLSVPYNTLLTNRCSPRTRTTQRRTINYSFIAAPNKFFIALQESKLSKAFEAAGKDYSGREIFKVCLIFSVCTLNSINPKRGQIVFYIQ